MNLAAPWVTMAEMDGLAAVLGWKTRVFDSNGRQVASTYNQTRSHLQHGLDVAESNAQAISALPELLAACQAALPHHQGGHSAVGMLLREAIAKATGDST